MYYLVLTNVLTLIAFVKNTGDFLTKVHSKRIIVLAFFVQEIYVQLE